MLLQYKVSIGWLTNPESMLSMSRTPVILNMKNVRFSNLAHPRFFEQNTIWKTSDIHKKLSNVKTNVDIRFRATRRPFCNNKRQSISERVPQSIICRFLSFFVVFLCICVVFGVSLWKIYLNNRFKSSGELFCFMLV